jgi:WD40 repeat protein
VKRYKAPEELLARLPDQAKKRLLGPRELFLDTAFSRANDDFWFRQIVPGLKASQLLIVISTPDAFERRDGSQNWVEREIETFWEAFRDPHRIIVILGPGAPEDRLPGMLGAISRSWDWVDLRAYTPWSWLSPRRAEQLDDGFAKILAALYDIPLEHMPLLRREERRRRGRWIRLALVIMLGVSAGLGSLAYLAVQQRNLAVANERQALVALSQAASLRGRHTDAAKLALSALPRSVGDTRPMRGAALDALGSALSGAFDAPLAGQPASMLGKAIFSPDDSRILTYTERRLQLWNPITRNPLGEPIEQEARITDAAFSYDSAKILVGLENGTMQFWSVAERQPLGPPITVAVPMSVSVGRHSTTPLAVTVMHGGSVTAVVFSRDGKRALTLSAQSMVRLWDVDTGHPVGEPMWGADGAVFNSDGTLVLTRTGNASQLWDAGSGRPLGHRILQENALRHAAFDPTGTRILTFSSGGRLRLWDVVSGQETRDAIDLGANVESVAISPDGSRILAIAGQTARLWSVSAGQPLGQLIQHAGRITNAEFSPDGGQILTAAEDRTAQLWDAWAGQRASSPLRHDEVVLNAKFNQDGTRAITVTLNGSVRMWHLSAARPLGKPMLVPDLSSIVFSLDERTLVATSGRAPSALLDAASGRAIPGRIRSDAVGNRSLFSPDGRLLLMMLDGGPTHLWDFQSGRPLGGVMQHEGGVGYAIFSPDSKRLLTASFGRARLWKTETGELVGLLPGQEDVEFAEFSVDGARVLVVSGDNNARVWNVETLTPVTTPMVHEGSIRIANFSPDGTQVLTATEADDGAVRLWNAATGELVVPPIRQPWIRTAVFSPSGLLIGTGSLEGGRLWDSQTGRPLGPLWANRESGGSGDVAFSPDGKLFLAVDGRTLWLRSVQSGEQVGASMRHDDVISSASFSSDGKRILTASHDRSVRIWDANTGRSVTAPIWHSESVSKATFNRTSTRVASASSTDTVDGVVRLWAVSVPQGNVAEVACAALTALPDRDLSTLTRIYDLSVGDPICGSDRPLIGHVDRQ